LNVALRDLPSGTVTFLFTDIEGSTRLLQELGADTYSAALTEHRRLIRAAFARHRGVEVDTQGDAFFVAFGDAAAALAAAADAQQALAAGPIRVRMGLHTGTPHLGPEGYVGRDVHLGARIAAAGYGGQVLMSGATRESASSAKNVLDLGEHRLKDIAEPVAIFQLGDERFPPLKTISNTNLPRPASSFVGREREVDDVTALLRDGARLLTLTGPGGTGKTRLSIEAAAELVPHFKAGVFWVPLAALRDAALVSSTIGQTIGAKDGLAEHIGDREMLLLVDNLEQVIEAAPELAGLVESCPNLRLMTTSRELLRVRGEIEYAVPPLAEPEAVELFAARSGLPADGTTAELCRRLENLPLAVELAAARAGVLSPAQILERLSGRLDLLKGGRDADPRQRTLRAAIEWSYDLLNDAEKERFERLAVFAGGATLEAAEKVAGADIDTLQALVGKSLVRHFGDRFWMLETIREFAAEQLFRLGVADDVRQGHAQFFLELAEEAEPHLLPPAERDAWCDRLEKEHDNLRAAIEYFEFRGKTENGMRLAGAIAEFWEQRSHHREAYRRYAGLLQADELPTAARAKALNAAAMMAPVCGEMAQAKRWAEEALELHRRFGNEFGEANALWQLGYIRVEEGDLSAAEDMLRQATELMRRVGDETSLRWATRTLAFTYVTMGDLERARPLHEENLRRSREAGDRELQAATLGGLTDIAVEERRLKDAVDLQEQSLALVLHLNDELMAISRLCVAASVLTVVGRHETAATLVGYANSRYAEIGAVEAWVVKTNDRTLTSVRTQIGDDRLSDVLAEGAALSPENALRLATAEMHAASLDLDRQTNGDASRGNISFEGR
jgi:predicted ATPase/class 3 adenylate cyclase